MTPEMLDRLAGDLAEWLLDQEDAMVGLCLARYGVALSRGELLTLGRGALLLIDSGEVQ